MYRHLENQKGSAMVLSLLAMIFLAILLSGILPMVSSQVMLSSKNLDTIEAQYAAEAGVKRAIVGLKNNRTDWQWTLGDPLPHNVFVDGTEKYYTTSIDPQIADNSSPASDTIYTITSEGYVGNAHKKVVVKVKTASQANGLFKYSAFSNGTFYVNSGSNQTKIYGDISSNTSIDLNWTPNGSVTGYAYAPKGTVKAGYSQVTAGIKEASDQGTIDTAALTPSMPAFSMTGKDIGTTQQLTDSSYMHNGDYGLSGTYTIPDGKSVNLYINGTLSVYSGATITGGNITIYARDGIKFSGGSIKAGTGGTINLYTPRGLVVNTNSNIDGSTVNILAQQSVELNGGSINKNLSGAVTKIYTNDFTLNNSSSVISGSGVGMVVAQDNISITDGNAGTTLMIAGNNITAKANNNVKVGGLYANGTITITSITVLHDDSIASSINLPTSSGTGSDISIISWSNKDEDDI